MPVPTAASEELGQLFEVESQKRKERLDTGVAQGRIKTGTAPATTT